MNTNETQILNRQDAKNAKAKAESGKRETNWDF